MPKNINIPLKDLQNILSGDSETIRLYKEQYENMKEFEYPTLRLEQRYWEGIECKICGKLCKGEHGYTLHMKTHK